MEPTRLSRFRGCLTGLAIGDALGMSVETMTPNEILYATDGLGIRRCMDTIQTTLRSMEGFRSGDTTDDWQLTKAVARSIIKKGDFDIVQCAHEQTIESQITTNGWGKSTKNSVKSFAELFAHENTPTEKEIMEAVAKAKAKSPGTGNGIAMKVAPIGLYYNNPEDVLDKTLALGKLTHKDPRAWYGAYAVALIICEAIRQPIHSSHSEKMMMRIIQELSKIELPSWSGKTYCYEEPIVNQFTRILSMGLLDDFEKLRDTIGTNCFCVESIPFAIAVFLRHPRNFRVGVLEAVNAGGDTDTTAAMVGAMIGANIGLEEIPQDLIDQVPATAEASAIAQQLHNTK